ncbi:MAG: amidase, partial [Alphaproteobacteria bacterium]
MIGTPAEEITGLSIKQLCHQYRSGESDPVHVTEAYLTSISKKNAKLNAFLNITSEDALQAASASINRWRSGSALSPIDGVPIAIKDNIDLCGFETTNGCKFGPIARQDAYVVKRLKAAGAIILGKLNQHELALGTTTNNPHFGPSNNPVGIGITPGGSSGGSGVAVVAGLAAASLGTDTMGSVRIPASYCGCFGIKPTFGVVSNQGVSPLAFSLDHVGPLTRTAEDLELMLNAMTNKVLDPTEFKIRGLRIGRVKQIEETDIQNDVLNSYRSFLQRLSDLGATLVDVSWPELNMTQARLAGLLISEVDAASAYADDLALRPDRFSPEIRSMISYGRDAKPEKIQNAKNIIAKAGENVNTSFKTVDVIAAPTAP